MTSTSTQETEQRHLSECIFDKGSYCSGQIVFSFCFCMLQRGGREKESSVKGKIGSVFIFKFVYRMLCEKCISLLNHVWPFTWSVELILIFVCVVFLSIYLSIYLSICLSFYLSCYLFFFLSIYVSLQTYTVEKKV